MCKRWDTTDKISIAALLLGVIQVVPFLQRSLPSTPEINRSLRCAGFMACAAWRQEAQRPQRMKFGDSPAMTEELFE
jgi:hypothetical protein